MNASGTSHRFMAALMISSQVLLTGFVVYWLLGQFREERIHLHSQLMVEYHQVYDSQVDSMLMEHLVIPSLDDSILVRIHDKASFHPQSWIDSGSAVVFREEHIGELPKELEMHAIGMEGRIASDSGVQTINVSSVISDEERMVKSVKLFINKNQEAFQMDSGMQIFALSPDSSLLLMEMEQSMLRKDWPFALDWPEKGSAELAHRHGMLLEEVHKGFIPGLRVKGFSIFLVRAILPQILFGLVLLTLSASALLFAYRSLLRQLTLNKLRDDFISNISHELKTPVSTVKVALEALGGYNQQENPRLRGEYLEMASKEINRLEMMVDRVLHHQMLNDPAMVLHKDVCELRSLVDNLLLTLDIPIREKYARIIVNKPQESCIVQADRVYLEGVILNLIDNSLKYAGNKPKILISIACNATSTSLSVSDNGPGIPEEYKDLVFDKFFRVPSGNRHNVKGYGLGLNFARQVMAQHKGQISLTNLPDGGCSFTLTFPNS